MAFLDDIKNEINQITSAFQGRSSYAVSRDKFSALLNRIEPSKWNTKSPLPYSFKVDDAERLGLQTKFNKLYYAQANKEGPDPLSSRSPTSLKAFLKTNSDIGKALVAYKPQSDVDLFNELFLQINPSDLQQDENFAINITPTQDGIVSEHNGIVFKDLTISGTTGIHPLRGVSGVVGTTVVSNPSAKSGYEHFLEIRNYFRAYGEAKKKGKNRNLVLLFKNRKDNETLIIEPIKFSLKRNSSKPFSYDYTIVTKVLKSVEPTAEDSPWSLLKSIEETSAMIKEKLDIGRGILLESQNVLRNIESEIDTVLFEPFRKFSLVLNDAAGLAHSLYDLPSNIKRNFDNSVIKAFNDAISILPGISGPVSQVPKIQNNKSIASAKSLTPTGLQNKTSVIADGVAATQINAEEILPANLQRDLDEEVQSANSLPRSFYEDLLQTTNSIRDTAAEKFNLNTEEYNTYVGRVDTLGVPSFKKPTNQELLLLYGLDQMASSLELFLTSREFGEDLDSRSQEAEERFGNSIQIDDPSSAIEVIIEQGQTLEDLASIYLGTPNAWTDIAILNNLKSPYIDENPTSDKVKTYGDRILIPSTADTFTDAVVNNKNTKISRQLNNLEKQMGVDIKLTENFDFSFNNRGDVNLIAGAPNAGQAIVIKLTLEKGDLRYHPELGLNTQIGEKLKDPFELKEEIIKSLQQDSRFEQITKVNFRVGGNTIRIDMQIKLKNTAVPIPVTI